MIVAEEFLAHSKELYNNKKSDGEIILRNVARNAYYALFHKLSVIELECIHNNERSFGSHEQLIQQLRSSIEPKYRELGLTLAALKSVRTKADYHLQQHFSDQEAYSTIRKVDKVFHEFSELNSIDKQSPEITTKDEIKEPSTYSNTNNPPRLSIVK